MQIQAAAVIISMNYPIAFLLILSSNWKWRLSSSLCEHGATGLLMDSHRSPPSDFKDQFRQRTRQGLSNGAWMRRNCIHKIFCIPQRSNSLSSRHAWMAWYDRTAVHMYFPSLWSSYFCSTFSYLFLLTV